MIHGLGGRPARERIAAVVLTVALAGTTATAGDWPGWRGPGREAVSPEKGLLQEWPAGGPPLLWAASGLGTGFSGLAVVGDRIFTIGDKDGAQHVLALNRADGTLTWSA
jgi:hypothetical protein